MGHKRLSASQTKRWRNCAGYVPVMEDRPDLRRSSGYYAQLGTAAHGLGERCLKEGSSPYDYKGRIIVLVGEDEDVSILRKNAKSPKDPDVVWFEVDMEMMDAVDDYVSYVRSRCVGLGLVDEGFNDKERAREVCNLVAKGTVLLEQHVNPLDRDDTGGTADARIDDWPYMLEVVDYKHGSGVYVPIERNDQLRSYVLGAAKKDQFSHEIYRYTIVQPRCLGNGPTVRSEEMTREELQEWAEALGRDAGRVDEATKLWKETKSMQALTDAGFLSIGEDGAHCSFCELQKDCPAARHKVQALAAVDFDDEPETIAEPDMESLGRLLKWTPFVDRWVRDVEASAERLLMQGKEVPGKKLVRKKASGRIFNDEAILERDEDGVPTKTLPLADEKAIIKALVDQGFLNENETAQLYTEPKFRSGPQIEKLIEKGKRGRFSQMFLHMPEGGITVADESDPREAIRLDPASDFEDDPDA